jgi:hypothetical protein
VRRPELSAATPPISYNEEINTVNKIIFVSSAMPPGFHFGILAVFISRP